MMVTVMSKVLLLVFLLTGCISQKEWDQMQEEEFQANVEACTKNGLLPQIKFLGKVKLVEGCYPKDAQVVEIRK